MFKNILVPADGSDGSLRAAQIAARLAASVQGVRITLVNVLAEDTTAGEDVAREAHAILDRVSDELANLELPSRFAVQFDVKVIEGATTAQAIAAETGRGGYDLLVMASRTICSDDPDCAEQVTKEVLRQVSVPVVVLPLRERVG